MAAVRNPVVMLYAAECETLLVGFFEVDAFCTELLLSL